MKNYWPLIVIVLVLTAIVGMSQYADSAKHRYEDSARQPKAESVAESDVGKPRSNTVDPYKPPQWAKYVTFPEGVGAWAVMLTLLAIVWQSIETRKAANATEEAARAAVIQSSIQRESLRPRLSISKFSNDTFNEARLGEWVFVKMDIANSGGMPAYGVVVDTWIEFVSGLPPYKLSSEARYARSAPFNVHAGVPSGFFIPLHRKLTELERHQLAKAKGTIIFRARMLYKAFGEDAHTDEAYIVRRETMDAIAEYSSAT
jgi:hypothetical protein